MVTCPLDLKSEISYRRLLLPAAFESPDDFVVEDFAAGTEAGSLLVAGTVRTALGVLRRCHVSLSDSIFFSLRASRSIVGRELADVEDDDRSPARSL